MCGRQEELYSVATYLGTLLSLYAWLVVSNLCYFSKIGDQTKSMSTVGAYKILFYISCLEQADLTKKNKEKERKQFGTT